MLMQQGTFLLLMFLLFLFYGTRGHIVGMCIFCVYSFLVRLINNKGTQKTKLWNTAYNKSSFFMDTL